MAFTKLTSDQLLPLEFVFNPHWWNKTAGISFERPFYFDSRTRELNDVIMRRVLFEQLGEFGFGEESPQKRPIIGSEFVAGGFIAPALMGADVRFSVDAAPQPLENHWDKDIISKWRCPNDIAAVEPLRELIHGWDEQMSEFGYLCGDLCTDGLLNTAYHFYGSDLYSDLLDDPEIPMAFMDEIGKLTTAIAGYVQKRSGTASVAVNRQATHLSPSPFIHSNCSVQMISPRLYAKTHLPIEQRMAEQIQPFGVHHCGVKMHTYAKEYAKIPISFCDVGWESDTAKCREYLPDTFLNLRLSPIRMLRCNEQEIAQDLHSLLDPLPSLTDVGVCCINMDYGTPIENIRTVCAMVAKYRQRC